MKRSLVHGILAIVTVSICFESLFVALMMSMVSDAARLSKELEVSHRVVSANTALAESIHNCVVARFSLGKTGQPGEDLNQALEEMHLKAQRFETLCQENGLESQLLPAKAIKKDIESFLSDELMTRALSEGPLVLISYPDSLKKYARNLAAIRDLNAKVSSDESANIARKTAELTKKQANTFYFLGGGLVLNLALAIFILGAFNRRMMRRLETLSESINAFARGEKLITADPIEDEIGEISKQFSSVAGDLTEARSKFQATLDNLHDSVCLIDRSERIVLTNSSFEKLTGFAGSEMLGTDCSFIVPRYAPLETALYNQREARIQLALRKRDQSLVDTLWSITPESDNNGYIVLIKDQTEESRRRSQLEASRERFHSLLDSLLAGLLLMDEACKIEYVNKTAAQMLGLRNDLQYSSASQILPEKLSEQLQAKVGQKIYPSFFEFTLNSEDKKTRHLSVSLMKLQQVKGANLVVTILDISESKEIDQMKNYFLSMISHDLRTPLASISCSVELVKATSSSHLSSNQKSEIRDTLSNLSRLSTLVDNFMDLERIRSDELKVRRTPASLKRLLEEVVATQPTNVAKSIKLAEVPSNLIIFLDEARIKQSIASVLKFFVDGLVEGDTINIKTETNGERVRLVASCGKGVPIRREQGPPATIFYDRNSEHPADNIFQDLGLAVSARLINIHGGTFSYKLAGTTCTEFAIELPSHQIEPLENETTHDG